MTQGTPVLTAEDIETLKTGYKPEMMISATRGALNKKSLDCAGDK